ncbi:MAG: hypothetical protein WAV02_02365 [Stellaceae bacterium]
MNMLQEVMNELRGMFVADGRLAIGIAALITVAAALARMFEPLAAGGVLLFGCIAILIGSVVHKARSEASR